MEERRTRPGAPRSGVARVARPTDGVSEGSEPVLGEILKRARTHRGLTLRQVEERTGLPNAHLSQIERSVIRRPDPAILMELTELYDLNYALVAEWSGYLSHATAPATGPVLKRAMRLLADLSPATQAEAVRYLEGLRADQDGDSHQSTRS